MPNPLDPRPIKRGRPPGSRNKDCNIPSKIEFKPKKEYPTAFKKGHAGGPGRPQGSRNNVTLYIEEIGEANAIRALEHLIALSLGEADKGDIAGCRYILERLCPPRKGYRINPELSLDIRNANTAKDIDNASIKITSMMLSGVLSAEEADGYCKVLDHRLKTLTDIDLLIKIEETRSKVDSLYTDR